ncbi:MAG: preprotein translocase subunit YajC [Desulfovibrionaceae bacterium]|nr:preprotein translocase subunit YajC [Desulfovibrionaceae bacterium]MBF0512801.1 preprotein translocase subunit YajC [Desulfovibrionaceae bacterium]
MFFDSIAHAMGAAPGADGKPGNPLMSFLPLILMFVIFYFLLIRPQQKKAKEQKAMLGALKKGDYILTGGGLYGRILDTDGDVLTVELSKGIEIKVNRNYVNGLSEPVTKEAKSKDKEEKK